MSTTYTIISWGVTLALVLGAIHIYNPSLARKLLDSSRRVQVPSTSNIETSIITKKQKAKKPLLQPDTLKSTSSTENLSGKEARASKKRKINVPASGTSTHVTDRDQNLDEERTINDSDFAQQLRKAQSGTKLQSKSQPKAPIANRLVEDKRDQRQPLSVSEAEVDDDESSEPSAPPLHTFSSKDISDMLEAPAAGPTTLRLTNVSTDSKKPNQAKKQFEQVQSKKKRNEQKRREEQKREIEESNQLWERKKQEQLRMARLAAGTSNQTKANAFTSTASAWQKKPQTPSSEEKVLSNGPLLDTFEMTNSKDTAPSVQTASIDNLTNKPLEGNNLNAFKTSIGDNRTSALAASAREQGPSGTSADPWSEESQIRRLHEQDRKEAWEAVTSKKTKKKSKAENDTSSDTSSVPPPVPSTFSQTNINGTKMNGTMRPKEDSNRFQSIQNVQSTGLHDDEWGA